MNRRHSLIQPAPSVRAGAGRRQGKVGLLQREGDHPWRRSFPATFQHPLSPCDTVTRLEVHKGGVWTQEQGVSRDRRGSWSRALHSATILFGLLTRTNETELRFRSGARTSPYETKGNWRTRPLPSEGR